MQTVIVRNTLWRKPVSMGFIGSYRCDESLKREEGLSRWHRGTEYCAPA
jgi:hypothetical protein